LLYGEEVEVFVRPEDVELYPLNDQSAGCFEAQISGLEFLGPVCRISLEANGLRFEADVSPALTAALGVVPGARLLARFRPDRVMIFPANG
jgi:iron(III) transport system ATP-binding protein